jgi:hypothetical protein
MFSGLMVALGGICVGIGFVILGASAFATTYSPNYEGGFFVMLGIGAMFIGLSYVFARVPPRIR